MSQNFESTAYREISQSKNRSVSKTYFGRWYGSGNLTLCVQHEPLFFVSTWILVGTFQSSCDTGGDTSLGPHANLRPCPSNKKANPCFCTCVHVCVCVCVCVVQAMKMRCYCVCWGSPSELRDSFAFGPLLIDARGSRQSNGTWTAYWMFCFLKLINLSFITSVLVISTLGMMSVRTSMKKFIHL